MVTGPKAENRSIRKSRSMGILWPGSTSSSRRMPGPIRRAVSFWGRSRNRLQLSTAGVAGPGIRRDDAKKLTLRLRRRQLHGFAAAAGADLVRVVEHELRLHLVGPVVHLGAQQEQHGLGIDQD